MENEKGFSLAEIMVAAGLLGLLAMAGIQLTGRFSSTLSFYDAKIAELETRTQINHMLSDSESCKNTFSGLIVGSSPVTLTSIKTKSNTPLFEVGKKIGDTITITNLTIENDPSDGVPATGGFGKINLVVEIQRPKNATGSPTSSFTLPVSVATGNGTHPAGVANREVYECGFSDIASILASKTCPPGNVLRGFDASANPICETTGSDELYNFQAPASHPGASTPPDPIKCAYVSHFHDSSDSGSSYDIYTCLR